MKKIIEFSKGNWENELVHINCGRWDRKPVFVQEADHIRNGKFGEGETDYDYVTIATPDKYTSDFLRVSAVCSFDEKYAPLMVFVKDLKTDENGDLWYSDYYEVVIYDEGVNVWRLYPNEENKIKWDLMMSVKLPLEAGKKYDFDVKIENKRLLIKVGGYEMKYYAKDLFDDFYVGITACEGINRFYSLTLEDNK